MSPAMAPEECPFCGEPVEWGDDEPHECVPGFHIVEPTLDIDAEVAAFAEELRSL